LPIQTKIAVRINPIIRAPIGCVRLVGKKIPSKVKTAIINPMTAAIAFTASSNSFGFLSDGIATTLLYLAAAQRLAHKLRPPNPQLKTPSKYIGLPE
jgi:hypothetical protein